MQNVAEMVFENPTNLATLLGDNYIVETLFDDVVYRISVGHNENSMAVVRRQTVIDYIANNMAGMARDVAKFAAEEQWHDDAVMISYNLGEAAQALEKVRNTTALWFYILPE
jgi:hypothetical protein